VQGVIVLLSRSGLPEVRRDEFVRVAKYDKDPNLGPRPHRLALSVSELVKTMTDEGVCGRVAYLWF